MVVIFVDKMGRPQKEGRPSMSDTISGKKPYSKSKETLIFRDRIHRTSCAYKSQTS